MTTPNKSVDMGGDFITPISSFSFEEKHAFVATDSKQELTLVPTRRAREGCYGGSRAEPTHGCTSSFTKDKKSHLLKQTFVMCVPGDKEKCVEQVDKLGEEVPPGKGKDTERVRGV